MTSRAIPVVLLLCAAVYTQAAAAPMAHSHALRALSRLNDKREYNDYIQQLQQLAKDCDNTLIGQLSDNLRAIIASGILENPSVFSVLGLPDDPDMINMIACIIGNIKSLDDLARVADKVQPGGNLYLWRNVVDESYPRFVVVMESVQGMLENLKPLYDGYMLEGIIIPLSDMVNTLDDMGLLDLH